MYIFSLDGFFAIYVSSETFSLNCQKTVRSLEVDERGTRAVYGVFARRITAKKQCDHWVTGCALRRIVDKFFFSFLYLIFSFLFSMMLADKTMIHDSFFCHHVDFEMYLNSFIVWTQLIVKLTNCLTDGWYSAQAQTNSNHHDDEFLVYSLCPDISRLNLVLIQWYHHVNPVSEKDWHKSDL